MITFLIVTTGFAILYRSSVMFNISWSFLWSPSTFWNYVRIDVISFRLIRVSIAEEGFCSFLIGRSRCWRFVLIRTLVEFNRDNSIISGSLIAQFCMT